MTMAKESVRRQVKRQLEMYLEDGERARITVALALLDADEHDTTSGDE